MRLLQLNVTANWGSTGKIAEGIGIAAGNRGWDSYIAYGRYMNQSSSKLIKTGNSFDVYMHYAQNRLIDGEGLGSKRATKSLIARINNLAPDILHLHNIHDHWINYPILFDYFSSIETPIIWTFHDCWAFTGGCAYFDSIDCKQWQNRCYSCSLRNRQVDHCSSNFNLKRHYFASLSKRLYLIPVSEWLDQFINHSFLKNCNHKVIHNGIDINKFNIITRKSLDPYILGVALPWSKRKGLSDFVKLSEMLPSDIGIYLVGLSQKQIKSLPSRVKGIEKTQNTQELVELYSGAMAFINPTYEDNFPTVNLEALACGTPVITYKTGGSPEAVDKNTGLVVDKGDISGLANSIMHIIEHPDDFTSESCRNRALRHFNKDIQFNKYIDLYESLINK